MFGVGGCIVLPRLRSVISNKAVPEVRIIKLKCMKHDVLYNLIVQNHAKRIFI